MEDAAGERNEWFTIALAGIQHGDQAFFIDTKNGFTHKLVLALEKRRQPSSLPAAAQTVPHAPIECLDTRAGPALRYMPGAGWRRHTCDPITAAS